MHSRFSMTDQGSGEVTLCKSLRSIGRESCQVMHEFDGEPARATITRFSLPYKNPEMSMGKIIKNNVLNKCMCNYIDVIHEYLCQQFTKLVSINLGRGGCGVSKSLRVKDCGLRLASPPFCGATGIAKISLIGFNDVPV
jgi:hypothetical protein